MAKNTSPTLNVFIGCPGDMAPERDAILASRDHIESVVCPVKFRTWKMSASGVGEAQCVIFANDPVASFDIVVILLWTRLGVSSGIFDPLTKTEMTGTEAEFVAAYDLHKANGERRPQVLLYHCKRDLPSDVDLEQLGALRKFFKQTEKGGLRPMLAPGFKTVEELKDTVTRDLKKAAERLGALQTEPIAPAPIPPLAPKSASSDERLLLHRYFANLRDQFAIYENLGLPVPERDGREGEKDAPLPIRRLFVAPACTDAHFRPEAFDAALREGKNPATPLLPRLAPAKSRTVLLADPGMGKSTLIQWLISTLADEAVPPGAEALRGAIPLPFILRDLVTHLPHDVKGWNWDALVEAFRRWRHRGKGAPLAAPLTADDALFHATLDSENAFFLIDGLDEIGDPQRRVAIRDAIWAGFEKYPDARWLVTSRIVGYEQATVDRFPLLFEVLGNREEQTAAIEKRIAPYTKKGFGVEWRTRLAPTKHADVLADTIIHLAQRLHLAPFDNDQQLAFARNWYVPRLGDAAGTQRADDFIAAVHRNDHTRVISRVPNLLYLLALLFRHSAHLPNGRALVYAAISSAYLADIDLDRRLHDSLLAPWKFEEKEDLLALVAMRMQEIRVAEVRKGRKLKSEILVTRAQLEEWLGPRFGGKGDEAACKQLTDFLDHIANRSGLLLPRGEAVFGFAHLSFQEFYAACHLQKDFVRIGEAIISGEALLPADSQFFAQLAGQPVWHEPLLFLVERLRESAPFTKRLLKWLFPQLDRDDPAKGKKWMPFPAAQLLATLSIDPEIALDDAQREALWKALWIAHIAAWRSEWNVAPHLVAAGSVFQSAVLRAAAALQPKRFHLVGCLGVRDLQPLAGFTALNSLILYGSTGVSDLQPLAGLTALNSLILYGCTGVRDLQPLAGLMALKLFVLYDFTGVRDLQPLAGLTALNSLILNGCTGVSDLQPLAGLTALNLLILDDCTGVSDLQPLAGLTALNTLLLNRCTGVSELRPLVGLVALHTLYLFGCTGMSDAAVAALQAKLPKLMILGR